jgi:hypothetical protein
MIQRPLEITPSVASSFAATRVGMRNVDGSRSSRAIDSRSFSFDAGVRATSSARRKRNRPPSRTETETARPAAVASIVRIHLAFTTASRLASPRPGSFSRSPPGHQAR